MTIEKGQDWGSRAPLEGDVPIVSTDVELAALFNVRREGDAAPTLAGPNLVGLAISPNPTRSVDLARTVSARGTQADIHTGERTHLPIDLAIVTLDGQDHVMAASLVIRRPLWLGVVEGAMNASFLGDWNVAPSGHPNDGRLDVVRAELSAGDKWKARSRLASGTHIPHPNITSRRLKRHDFDPDSRANVWIDGHNHGQSDQVRFIVVPDATTIII